MSVANSVLPTIIKPERVSTRNESNCWSNKKAGSHLNQNSLIEGACQKTTIFLQLFSLSPRAFFLEIQAHSPPLPTKLCCQLSMYSISQVPSRRLVPMPSLNSRAKFWPSKVSRYLALVNQHLSHINKTFEPLSKSPPFQCPNSPRQNLVLEQFQQAWFILVCFLPVKSEVLGSSTLSSGFPQLSIYNYACRSMVSSVF